MKIIIDSIDVDISTAVRCVFDCVKSKQDDCVWTFTEKLIGKQIVVFDRKNKNSTTYKVYFDKNQNEITQE